MIGVSGGGGRARRLRRRWVGARQICRRLRLAGRVGIVEELPVLTSRWRLPRATQTEARMVVGDEGWWQGQALQEPDATPAVTNRCDHNVTLCDKTRFHGHARVWPTARGQ